MLQKTRKLTVGNFLSQFDMIGLDWILFGRKVEFVFIIFGHRTCQQGEVFDTENIGMIWVNLRKGEKLLMSWLNVGVFCTEKP